MTTAKKKPARKAAKKKSPTFGDRLIAAMEERATPEAAEAAIAGQAPPGASLTATRVPVITGPGVAALRKEFGVSQSAFAAFLNVSVQTVQAWEQGRVPVQRIALRTLVWMREDVAYFRAKLAG